MVRGVSSTQYHDRHKNAARTAAAFAGDQLGLSVSDGLHENSSLHASRRRENQSSHAIRNSHDSLRRSLSHATTAPNSCAHHTILWMNHRKAIRCSLDTRHNRCPRTSGPSSFRGSGPMDNCAAQAVRVPTDAARCWTCSVRRSSFRTNAVPWTYSGPCCGRSSWAD